MKKIDGDTIIFQYDLDNLLEAVSLKTSYKARLASGDYGMADDLSLLEDNRNAFEANIQKILADIYSRIVKLTGSVDNAFSMDGAYVTIKVHNNQAYNSNVLDIVDSSIYDCLECGSLKEWYSVCGKVDFEQEYSIKYDAALNLLSDRMFQLRKKLIKNTLGNLA